jgi:hypothetical protein
VCVQQHVKELILDECSLGNDGMEALRQVVVTPSCGLCTISLWKNKISVDVQKEVGKALQGHQSLKTVDFPQPVVNGTLAEQSNLNRG